jgi:CheY-like chemotaxis protein/HAMP domain-containing protein
MNTAWHRLSLKSRLIFPVIVLLLLAMFTGGYVLSHHEQSGIRLQLEREASMLANSLYNSSVGNREKLIKEQATLNPAIHSVQFLSADEQILYAFNRNQIVDRLLPGDVQYHQQVFADGSRIKIGMFDNSMLTLIFIYSAGALLVMFIVVALLNVLLNNEVLLPINRLEQHMIRMAQGMLDKMIITENQSEIGHLSQSVNAVRTRLKRLLAVQLPAASGDASSLLDTIQFQSQPAAASLTDARILITDDDPTIRMLAGKILEKAHAKPSYAENGQACLAMLAKESFDMVLLDLIMPEVSGFDVLHAIQNNPALQHTPVIVISSMPQKEAPYRRYNWEP